MVKRIIILLCALSFFHSLMSQDDSLHAPLNHRRLNIVAAGNAVLWGTSYIVLNKAWYAGYAKTRFHTFDDLPEWNQMDKAGHIWSSYQVSRLTARTWKWAGVSDHTSALLGGAGGLVYQGIIEMQDAYSSEWGFSWSDIGANVIGAGAFTLQELAWRDQRLQIKMGSFPHHYPAALLDRRNQLFGHSALERILKDYNSQTYWVSANLKSFFPESHLPPWLNVAAGYGAEGMYGGRTNTWTDKAGTTHDYRAIGRIRKFYLAPDVDLTKIKVSSSLLRSIFFLLNMVKIPAPALELKGGKAGIRAIKF